MKKRKWIPAVLAAVFAVGLLTLGAVNAQSVLADDIRNLPDLYVNGQEIYDSNYGLEPLIHQEKLPKGMEFDPATYTLTLTNATLEANMGGEAGGCDEYIFAAANGSDRDLHIKLVGTNKITCHCSDSEDGYCLIDNQHDNVILEGSGSLTITADNPLPLTSFNDSLIIQNCTLNCTNVDFHLQNMTLANCKVNSSWQNYDGEFFVQYDLTVRNSAWNINTGARSKDSYGFYIDASGTLLFDNCTVQVTGDNFRLFLGASKVIFDKATLKRVSFVATEFVLRNAHTIADSNSADKGTLIKSGTYDNKDFYSFMTNTLYNILPEGAGASNGNSGSNTKTTVTKRIYGLSFGGFNSAKNKRLQMAAGNDAKSMRKCLLNNKLKGYKFKNSDFAICTPKGAPTKKEIDTAIKNAFKKAKKNDLCYFCYSGHGSVEIVKDKPVYSKKKPKKIIDYKIKKKVPKGIAIVNKKSDKTTITYTYKDLIKTLDKNCKGHVIMIVAACHSGGFAEAAKGNKKFTVITACTKEEKLGGTEWYYSAADPKIKDNLITAVSVGYVTLFGFVYGIDFNVNDLTYFVKKGMKGSPKKMDTNKDHKITVKEFYNYLKTNMKNRRGKHPQCYLPNPKMVIYQY